MGTKFNPGDKTPPSPDKEFIIHSMNEMDINFYLQNIFNSWFINCDGININIGAKSPIEFLLEHLLELDLIILIFLFCFLIKDHLLIILSNQNLLMICFKFICIIITLSEYNFFLCI